MEKLEGKIRTMDGDLSARFIVSGCEDALVRLFRVKEDGMELLSELPGHAGPVTKALFINRGELIASSDFVGNLILWKLEGRTFTKRAEISLTTGPIYDIAVRYSENAIVVFCGCDNGVLKKVVFDNNFKTTVTDQEVHRYGVLSVHCNDHFVATGGLDCSVALISNDGNIEYFKHHTAAVNAVGLAPSEDDKHMVLATCSEDGKLVILIREGDNTRTQEFAFNEPCFWVDWSNTGLVLTTGYGEEGFKCYIQGEDGDFEEIPMETAKATESKE